MGPPQGPRPGRHRRGLADPDPARAVWAALDGAVRGIGTVENFHSALAPQRARRRGLPPTTLALASAYRDHHRFESDARTGRSPLQMAGLPSPDWLDALGYAHAPVPDPSPQLGVPARLPKTVNRKAV